MNRLADRHPHVRRVSAVESDDPESVFHLVEPYLDWQLAEIDIQSTDILIVEPLREGVDPTFRQMLILGGQAVSVWLRHRGTAPADANSQ
jgi:hypothetical protein